MVLQVMSSQYRHIGDTELACINSSLGKGVGRRFEAATDGKEALHLG